MKFSKPFLINLIIISFILSSSDKKKKDTPIESQPTLTVFLADPTIFNFEGTYYLYGTSQGSLVGRGNGFLVFTSDDLKEWEGPIGATEGFALKDTDAFGDTGFWAPQVFHYNNTFYMAYTANEKIAVATSNSPLGPFTNSGTSISDITQIDPFIFIDDDDKKYMYHVRLNNGNRICVAEMNDDLQSIKPETLSEIISAQDPWENTENASWPVTEGPTVIKENDLYYLVYSANDFRNPDYAVGFATSNNPMGPWTKADINPIIHGNMIGESGSGHGDMFFDKNGKMQYVIHTHFSTSTVLPRKTGIIELKFDEQNLTAKEETFKFLEQIVE